MLRPLPITTFREVAALGLVVRVWCMQCKSNRLIDPADPRWANRSFAGARFACTGCDGSSLYLVGKVLGHVQASTTQRYAHLQLDPVRAVADRTARKIAGALKGRGAGSNVLALAGRRRA